jgi:transposase-like protein
MKQTTPDNPFCPTQKFSDALTEILQEGARGMLAAALKVEAAAYIQQCEEFLDDMGRRLVTRNGCMPERTIQTGIGDIPVRQPRINDRRVDENGERMKFTSAILPPYLRKTKQMEEFIPWLYLKGVSTGDMSEALAALLGPDAKGLSATTVMRLTKVWQDEFDEWSKRDLTGKRYVYFWADGVYPGVRLGNEKPCLLVIIGATEEGRKELVAVHDGVRESTLSWRDVFLDLKRRGLQEGPELSVGDGALGFWKALETEFPKCRKQRCWVHKTMNVLNKLPKSVHGLAKSRIHDIWMADTKKNAEAAFDNFLKLFEAKYPKAVECLEKDRDVLLTFYDFPAEHWVHIRTTNPIESTFATVDLRTRKTKGAGSGDACCAMVFKLMQCAEKHWRKLNGSALIQDVIRGVKFKDGVKVNAA